jgi:hypothetical protein
MPEPADVEPKQVERGRVHGHPIIMDVSVDHRAQPLAHLRDRVVHASPEFGGDLTQLSLQSLANRLPQHRKPSLTPLLSADMREAKEVEAFGLPLTAPQLQSELPNTLGQFLPAALGIRPVLESEHDIIGEPDDNHVAVGLLLAPRPDPQVEHVVETDVREQWRCAAALRRPFFHRHPFSCRRYIDKAEDPRAIGNTEGLPEAERCAAMRATTPEKLNLITLHLGAGCSATAIRQGRSVDTSMGLAPLEGLMMGTRSGDIDPAIFSFLAARENLSPDRIERILNHESGRLGVSGISDDLRKIQAGLNKIDKRPSHRDVLLPRTQVHWRVHGGIRTYGCDRVRARHWEHSDNARELVCSGLDALGIIVDPEGNRRTNGRETRISAEHSPVAVYVVPLDEELYIARAAARLLSEQGQPNG